MNDDQPPPESGADSPSARHDALSSALRANLKRRKAQQRARDAKEIAAPAAEGETNATDA